MICNHQFISIKQVIRPAGSNTFRAEIVSARYNDQYGVIMGCALCGEVRSVFENGELTILYDPNQEKEKGFEGGIQKRNSTGGV